MKTKELKMEMDEKIQRKKNKLEGLNEFIRLSQLATSQQVARNKLIKSKKN